MQKQYLERTEAAEYLTARGLRITKATLQKFATVGGGPAYQRFGLRVVYTLQSLDEWAEKKLSPLKRSTSEAA